MKKYVCLRDDDTNFFTDYDELVSGYGEYWGKLPITLATIPFVHGSERKIMDFDMEKDKFNKIRDWQIKASAEELSLYHAQKPIGLNNVLVSKLMPLIQDGLVEIAQHGVTHRFDDGGAEMKNGNYNYRIIRDGKEYLEKVFNIKVNVFIPPSNTIDRKNAKVLKSLGLKLFSCGSIYHYSKLEKVIETLKHPIDIIGIIKIRRRKSVAPYNIREGIAIATSHTFDTFKDEEDFCNEVIEALNRDGFVSITTHYRLLGEGFSGGKDYRAKYHKLLKLLTGMDDVEFVTASRYFEMLEDQK